MSLGNPGSTRHNDRSQIPGRGGREAGSIVDKKEGGVLAATSLPEDCAGQGLGGGGGGTQKCPAGRKTLEGQANPESGPGGRENPKKPLTGGRNPADEPEGNLAKGGTGRRGRGLPPLPLPRPWHKKKKNAS